MKILLINGNDKADFLISALKAKGHTITVVDPDYSRCRALADTFEVTAFCGDGTKEVTLAKAGAEQADAVVALDVRDSVNLVACELAKNRFHVRLTYASVNNPKNVAVFKQLGVDKCVSEVDWIVNQVEQDSLEDNIKKYLPIENGRIVICEAVIGDRSPALNQKLWEIGFPPQSIVSCIIRGEETIIPQGSTQLAAGDKIVLISSSRKIDEALSLLSGGKPRKKTG
ncbi:MAG: TrkA family potassium uptake protein [Clostridiales bacterium]|jgi:trk system potassium uptake protein TrkA|nr:TrkA family potassium uptake protein [Clostridiales bacterium]